MIENQIDLKKHLKILIAMLKSPKMCDLFFKYEKKNQTLEMFKKTQEDAIFTLRQYRFDENAKKFVKDVYEAVQDQVNEGKKYYTKRPESLPIKLELD